jgi:hypothetical protein
MIFSRKDKLLSLFQRKEWKDIDYVAIVSTGRTGTKFFSSFFNEIPNTLAFHEPFISSQKLSFSFFKKEVNFENALKLFLRERKVIQYRMLKDHQSFFIESDGFLRLLIPVIKTLPNYKIIHVIRDPKDWVTSFANRTIYVNGEPKSRYLDDNNWGITPYDVQGTDKLTIDHWQKKDIIFRGIWAWKFYNSEILRQIKDDDNCISIRFEDIFSKDKNFEGTTKLCEFIGLNLDQIGSSFVEQKMDNRVNTTKDNIFQKTESWNIDHLRYLNDQCSDMLKKFNYLLD